MSVTLSDPKIQEQIKNEIISMIKDGTVCYYMVDTDARSEYGVVYTSNNITHDVKIKVTK
jgi:hypothetical protein